MTVQEFVGNEIIVAAKMIIVICTLHIVMFFILYIKDIIIVI